MSLGWLAKTGPWGPPVGDDGAGGDGDVSIVTAFQPSLCGAPFPALCIFPMARSRTMVCTASLPFFQRCSALTFVVRAPGLEIFSF